ncbi:hypothetical protein [Seohaeicola zhoushanensis]|uniref:DUF1877 family protein n=1 Tax=Seohaeicola zhoushanensis TaxID=1569283 RepID=A0A8J3H4C4_9RHOB|nr:hypothetical protein [Seohaeicola zhoushanensis]GHF75954.1 hypothetical protein GCM10017056_52900 [Seohaeicola zhoushanensis]
MGLDIGFYRQDETEALGFRNHGDLFDMFIAQPHVRVEPYDDFYVTRPMVTAVLEEIEEEMTANGLPPPTLPDRDTIEFADLRSAIPREFFFGEPDDWVAALPFYRVLLAELLDDVRRDGCLICGWSA